jgi:hypothetical protein
MQPPTITPSSNNKKTQRKQDHRVHLYQILSELDNDQLRLVLNTHLQNPPTSNTFPHYSHAQLFQQCSVLIDNYYSTELEQTIYAIREKRFPPDYHSQQNFSLSLNQQQQPYYYAQLSVQPTYRFPPTSNISQQPRSSKFIVDF